MFNLSGKNIFQRLSYIVMNNSYSFVRCISRSCSDPSQSLAYSYLIDKFGLSPESAMSACKQLQFRIPNNAESVVEFLEKHGFSKTQIQRLIGARADILLFYVETLLPKVEFFQSKGVSRPELVKLLIYNPAILAHSLENRVAPTFNHISKLLQSDDKAITAIKRFPRLVTANFDAKILANINILLDSGVPESNIRAMFLYNPRAFVMIPDSFKEIVKEVKEMGLDPLDMKFLRAVIMFRKMSKPILEKKFCVFKEWGWSEQDIWEAIRNNPHFVYFAEETIMARMDFLVNRMGIKPLLIANQPSILRWSLKKRIVPRGLYAHELLSKGLLKKFTLSGLYDTSEKTFIQRYVNRYEDIAPELSKLYKEKLELAIGGKY